VSGAGKESDARATATTGAGAGAASPGPGPERGTAKAPGPRLVLEQVARHYGDCIAVAEASVTLEPGAVHAIVGENGAGKSTLLKIAAGVVVPSSGRVLVDGKPLSPATAAEAIRRGIGMVHQHFMLVGAFRAVENLVLGSEPVQGPLGRLDLARAAADAEALGRRTGLSVRLDALTSELTVGERQRLEILRVLYRGARALLLDEPTAVLSPQEADELYANLRRLADEGVTVAVVTHRLGEVTRFADDVTVMRGGRVVRAADAATRAAPPGAGGRARDAAAEEALTRAIMGGEPPAPVEPPPLADDAAPVLRIAGLSLDGDAGQARLSAVDLEVRSGEIVGIAGVEGNGQRELVRALAGMEPTARGSLRVADRDVPWSAPPATRRAFLGVVHEDRHADGLVLEATVGDNLVLGDLATPGFDEAAAIARRIRDFQVHPTSPALRAGELSGGNQQKLVIARALDRVRAAGAGAALICAQPTRGVDVGAAAAIHAAIGAAAGAGMAVLLVSADLGELRRLSHRICVMARGRIVATLPPDADEQRIGRAMLGGEEVA
jgi:simple sugar transport system ATP-binding protein